MCIRLITAQSFCIDSVSNSIVLSRTILEWF